MKAAQIDEFGPASVIKVREIPQPEPGDGQVLVEVHASSLNPFDTAVREGHAKPPLPATLGGDIAGVVYAVGAGARHVKPGDKVYGSANVFSGASGGLAEFASTRGEQVAPMPRSFTFNEAASTVLVGLSALQAIEDKMNLRAGQKILIHGAAGGIGSMAVQLAKHLGAHVAATATGPGVAYAKELGADEVIDYKRERFEDKLRDYDAVFVTVRGDTLERSFHVLRRGGVLVSMVGGDGEALAAQHGVSFHAQHTRTTPESLVRLTSLLESGALKPHVGKVFPLSAVRAAFEARESGKVLGKVVVEIKA
jgi:NADPH:quinone reductase-like Zn-dependent oxidoreductase